MQINNFGSPNGTPQFLAQETEVFSRKKETSGQVSKVFLITSKIFSFAKDLGYMDRGPISMTENCSITSPELLRVQYAKNVLSPSNNRNSAAQRKETSSTRIKNMWE